MPWLDRLAQPATFGPDTISDNYGAKVVLNDPSDMYVKAKVDQTPLEAATWSKEASAPYPPAARLIAAGLYSVGEWLGIGLYGCVLLLAVAFVGSSLVYCWRTRWYVFPLLYLNFSYFAYRFVYVQDTSYLIMLTVIMAALWLARAGNDACHPLMALAIVIKVSPLYYVRHVLTMRPPVAAGVVAILVAGLVLPYFVWDNYLSIFRFAMENKGSWPDAVAALGVVLPVTAAIWYIETKLGFDLEDKIGWCLVPCAMWFALKMNVPRHLLIVLLVPDKRVTRNLAAAAGLAAYSLFPSLMHFGAVGPITTALLVMALVYFLGRIGWGVVRDDLRHPRRTIGWLLRT